MEKFAAPRILS